MSAHGVESRGQSRWGGSLASVAGLKQSNDSAAWGDYDGDGYADLFVSRFSLGTSALYHNNRDGTFARVTDMAFGQKSGEFGTWADLDNDGRLDLLLVCGDKRSSVYFNNGDSNAWLKVKLVGTTSNRGGVGAKVRVQASYAGQVRWQRRDITAGDIYNGNNLIAHFGLGNAANVMTLQVEWPSCRWQKLRHRTKSLILLDLSSSSSAMFAIVSALLRYSLA